MDNKIFDAADKIYNAADMYERELITKQLFINTLKFQIEILQEEKTLLIKG